MPLTLLTGAPGWLGTRLATALVRGLPDVPSLAEPDPKRRIRCLVRPGVDASKPRAVSDRIEIATGDLRDPSAVESFLDQASGAILFHAASVIHPTRGTREFREVNVEGTENLLAAAERAGVRHAVVVSSNSPIGTHRDREHLFDEDSPYHPYLGYGRSKMEMEGSLDVLPA